jgi:hypothetical protein
MAVVAVAADTVATDATREIPWRVKLEPRTIARVVRRCGKCATR